MFAVLNSGTLYIMNYFHDMVDNIHQKRSWRPWNQRGSICLHLRRHIWNSHVHERCVTSSAHEGTPAWTKAKPSSSRRSHRKTYRPAEARIYHSCVELAIFIGKGSVHLKFSFWTHRMINFVVATGSRWRRSGLIRFHRLSLPQKLSRAFSRPGGGGDSDICHRDNVVTWQRKLRLLSTHTLNCF